MEHLVKLSKILRYAGLNLEPQLLNIFLDKNIRELVDTIHVQLLNEGSVSFESVDAIIADLQSKIDAENPPAEPQKKKPSLEKA